MDLEHVPVRYVQDRTPEPPFPGEVRTFGMSGKVDVVHGEPAQRLLASGGGMGAFLRYTT